MLYSEFIEGTGCSENAYNKKVFDDLNILYMNSDISKSKIYEYGRKLVDNSLSEEQKKFIDEMNKLLVSTRNKLNEAKERTRELDELLSAEKDNLDMETIEHIKGSLRTQRELVIHYEREMNKIKFVLAE